MLKKLIKPVLDEVQKELDKKHEEEGLTPEILELQIKLNKIRHISDISDETKQTHEEYVQWMKTKQEYSRGQNSRTWKEDMQNSHNTHY